LVGDPTNCVGAEKDATQHGGGGAAKDGAVPSITNNPAPTEPQKSPPYLDGAL
jgi:hypothetical protein